MIRDRSVYEALDLAVFNYRKLFVPALHPCVKNATFLFSRHTFGKLTGYPNHATHPNHSSSNQPNQPNHATHPNHGLKSSSLKPHIIITRLAAQQETGSKAGAAKAGAAKADAPTADAPGARINYVQISYVRPVSWSDSVQSQFFGVVKYARF